MDGLIIGVVLAIILFVAFLIEKKPWGWKGYEIIASWRERGLQGISAFWARITDLKKLYGFFASIIGLALLVLFFALYFLVFSILFNPNETKEFDSNFALAFLGTVSGFGALFGVYLAIRRTEEGKRTNDITIKMNKISEDTNKITKQKNEIAKQDTITVSLNKATENLGKKDGDIPVIEVRLGALLALERIAKNSIRDHIPIMKIVCAYICANSKLDNSIDLTKPLRADIIVAISIIAGRDKWSDGKKRIQMEKKEDYHIDLRDCDLRGADLFKANLTDAWIGGVNLDGAGIIGADLSGALLINTNLSGALLANTDLKGTTTRISFAYTGNFLECINLTQEQVNQMFCGIGVIIPENLTRPEHWPTDEMSSDKFYSLYKEWIK